MGARGKREAFSKRLWKTPLHVCTCSQPFPKRLSRQEFPAFSTIAAASIGHALQHKSDPPKRQENQIMLLPEMRNITPLCYIASPTRAMDFLSNAVLVLVSLTSSNACISPMPLASPIHR